MFSTLLLALSYNYYCYLPGSLGCPRGICTSPSQIPSVFLVWALPLELPPCPQTSFLHQHLRLEFGHSTKPQAHMGLWAARAALLCSLSPTSPSIFLPLTAAHPTAPDNPPPTRASISKGSRQAGGPGTPQSTACAQDPALENTCRP